MQAVNPRCARRRIPPHIRPETAPPATSHPRGRGATRPPARAQDARGHDRAGGRGGGRGRAPRPRSCSRSSPRRSPPRGRPRPAPPRRSAARASRGRVSKVTAPTMELSPYAQGGWRLLGDPRRFPCRPYAALLRAAFRSLLEHPHAGLGEARGRGGRCGPCCSAERASERRAPASSVATRVSAYIYTRVRAAVAGVHTHRVAPTRGRLPRPAARGVISAARRSIKALAVGDGERGRRGTGSPARSCPRGRARRRFSSAAPLRSCCLVFFRAWTRPTATPA